MDMFVKKYSDFIEEDLNFTRDDEGICKLEDKWFYYVPEDDIIYGCGDIPVNDNLFSFNPSSCTFVMNGEEKQYDVNNPILLVSYDMDKEEVKAYDEDAVQYLQSLGFTGDDIQSQQSASRIMDIFERDDEVKYILLYGDRMIASTFDVIEEN